MIYNGPKHCFYDKISLQEHDTEGLTDCLSRVSTV